MILFFLYFLIIPKFNEFIKDLGDYKPVFFNIWIEGEGVSILRAFQSDKLSVTLNKKEMSSKKQIYLTFFIAALNLYMKGVL